MGGRAPGRRDYSREFKEEAVSKCLAAGNFSQVGRELDVNDNILRRWVREKETGHWDKVRQATFKNPITITHNLNTAPTPAPLPARAANRPPPDSLKSKDHNLGELDRLRTLVEELTKERDLLKQMLAHYLKT